MHRSAMALGAGGCLWLLTCGAHAQERIALERYEPAPAGDALFGAPDATVTGHLAPSLGATVSFADSPLVLRDATTGEANGTIVGHQLVLHALGALSLHDRLLVDADVPFLLSQGGDSPRTLARTYASPRGTSLGDLRFGARLQVLRQRGALPSAAMSGRAWLPTARGAYAGAERARYALGMVLGGDHGSVLWRAAIERRQGDDGAELPVAESDVRASVGAAWRSGRMQLGGEGLGSTVASTELASFSPAATHLEALFSVRYRWERCVGGIALGPGLAAGQGTPAYRLLAGFAWMPGSAAAPRTSPSGSRGGRKGASPWTPVPDLEPQPDLPDTDGDGVTDGIDRCPERVGTTTAPQPGCPEDADRDGLPAAEDACPERAGVPAAASPGSLAGVERVGDRLVIRAEVRFESAGDALTKEGAAALAEVADYLRAHPEIARLAIDGHTDDVGDEGRNLELSRRRAVAVMRELLARGVDERRLEVRAFGPRRPQTGNEDAAGRAANRRVEFTILATRADGPRGWRDGPAEETPDGRH